MDQSLSDASDWLNTSLPPFSALETSLRCQVCKDFYTTPMITTCSHTFCSICIRRCLSVDGKCPFCRADDQASRLRRNWAIEEVVGTFKAARPTALEMATKDKKEKEEEPSRPSKRRRVERNSGGDELAVRTTRSKSKRIQHTEQPAATIDLADEGSDAEYIDNEDNEQPPEDGLVACPICQKRMKEEAVFNHIGTTACTSSSQQKPPTQPPSTSKPRPSSSTPKPIPDRLAELNYSLLNEKALRKKLTELGIPSTGSKTQLSRRHTEWVNLWNANVDAGAPSSKRDLLDELRKWDRSAGREPDHFSTGSSVMKKDFDAKAWSSGNKDEFAKLIEKARQGRKNKNLEAEQNNISEDQGQENGVDVNASLHKSPREAQPEKELPNGYHDASLPQETRSTPPPAPSIPTLSEESSLPEHFNSAQKTVNMFEVPSDPFRDVDTMQEK